MLALLNAGLLPVQNLEIFKCTFCCKRCPALIIGYMFSLQASPGDKETTPKPVKGKAFLLSNEQYAFSTCC